MPQMAPLNWLTLMFFFIMIFIMLNSLNYFSFFYNTPLKNSKKMKINNINWKW